MKNEIKIPDPVEYFNRPLSKTRVILILIVAAVILHYAGWNI